MSKWHDNDMLLDSSDYREDSKKIIFFGIDWERKDWTAAVCPRCQQPHRWRIRRPKHCRHCSIPFLFTASEAPSAAQPSHKEAEGPR